jgi:tetratricopeptide (TPR) repeat protein
MCCHLRKPFSGYSDPAGAKTLAEALGRLPLALDHAAAYCRRTQMQFGDYAKKVSSLIGTAPRGTGYPRSVAATFDLAIAEAVMQCPAAETLMAYLARCAPERIPMVLVEGAVEHEAERLQALAVLAEVSLLKHDPFADHTPAVTMHRLVQAVARARSEASGSALDAVERLIAQLGVILGPNPMMNLVLLARVLHDQGDFAAARPLYERWLAIYEKALGPEHRAMFTSLNNLARLLHDQGDFAAARPLFERALAICEKMLGPEHQDTAMLMSNFARLLKDTGHLNEAERLFRKAITISEKALGPDHSDTQRYASHYARLLVGTGRADEALELGEIALAAHDKVLGRDYTWTKDSARVTADALDALGRTEEAKELRERYGIGEREKSRSS